MADAAEVQVSHFLDQHGLGAFQIKLIIWSVMLAMIDGYDIGAIAFAAPSLIKEWHIAPSGARNGAQRQQYRRAVRLADLRLDRRPLRPQDRAHSLQPFVRHLHLHRRLFDQSHRIVLAALLRRAGHRRRDPESRCHQRRIGAAHHARHARHHRGRPGAARRRAGRLCRRGAGAAIWLADPVRDRRHRAGGVCARRHRDVARVDQIHDAA